MLVGDQMSMAYGSDTVVTGHSLGGGKAQGGVQVVDTCLTQRA
jgi:hypothetical protein